MIKMTIILIMRKLKKLKIKDHQDGDSHDEAEAVSNHLRNIDDQNGDEKNGRCCSAVSNHLRNGTSATSSAATVHRIWCAGRHLTNLHEHHIAFANYMIITHVYS